MPRLYTRWFAIAILSQVCFVLANTLMAHYARWVEFLEGDVSTVGWIMGAGPIAGLILRPWMGQWINRLGPRYSWGLGYGLFTLAVAGNLLYQGLGWPIYVLRCLLVLGSAFVFASSLTYVAQMAPRERRTEAIGTLGVGGFLGMLIGPISGDLILGEGLRTLANFNLLFGLTVLAMILPATFLLFLPAPPKPESTPQVRLRDFVRVVRDYWPGTVMFVNLAFGVCMSVPFGFLAIYIDDAKLSLGGFSVIGYFFCCYAGWGAFLRISLRRLPDRIGRRKVLLAGALAMGLGMFTFPLVTAENTWLMIVPGIICGTGHSLMFHTMTALALERFPPQYHGTGSAMSLMALDFGLVCGAPLLGLVAEHFSYSWMFIGIGSLCLLSGLTFAVSSIPIWAARREAGLSRSRAA